MLVCERCKGHPAYKLKTVTVKLCKPCMKNILVFLKNPQKAENRL